MRRVGEYWRVAFVVCALAGWCAVGGRQAWVTCAGCVSVLLGLLLIVAITPPGSLRRRFGLVAHQLVILTAGVGLTLGVPLHGYRSAGARTYH